MAKKDCDILIGTRGGMCFVFSNSRVGAAAIRERRISVGHKDAEAAKRACDAAGLVWLVE